MNTTLTAALVAEPPNPAPHRYQVYRQTRTGLHQPHGAILASPEHAVTLFLNTAPAFDGGGVHVWDHSEQRHAASAGWLTETTRMGFAIQHRVNVYHDPALAVIAAQIAERQQIEQALTDPVRQAM